MASANQAQQQGARQVDAGAATWIGDSVADAAFARRTRPQAARGAAAMARFARGLPALDEAFLTPARLAALDYGRIKADLGELAEAAGSDKQAAPRCCRRLCSWLPRGAFRPTSW